MTIRRMSVALVAAVGCQFVGGLEARAQCCFNDLFAGCGACMRKPPVYAVAPVAAPIVAPVAAPIAAPPPPVMVPVQQTSYVPETTYRTQYQNVPVTTYKPSCEVDPCTGCTRECMQPVTQYVQQAVNVPVTQYRAVTTTKYVQMQPGYGGGYPAAQPAMAVPAMAAPAPAVAAPATSPFAAPAQTMPQGWGAAGADIPPQLAAGIGSADLSAADLASGRICGASAAAGGDPAAANAAPGSRANAIDEAHSRTAEGGPCSGGTGGCSHLSAGRRAIRHSCPRRHHHLAAVPNGNEWVRHSRSGRSGRRPDALGGTVGHACPSRPGTEGLDKRLPETARADEPHHVVAAGHVRPGRHRPPPRLSDGRPAGSTPAVIASDGDGACRQPPFR
jgi:hypothetical protein